VIEAKVKSKEDAKQ
jgi:hypothetical protein